MAYGWPLTAKSVLTPMGARLFRMHDVGTSLPKGGDMPSGIYPVPPRKHHPSPGGERPSLALRARTRLKRRRLDQQISRGADPASSAELALRATQLGSRAGRSELADELLERLNNARLLEPLMVKVRLQYAELLESADELMALVERLRDERPIDLRGAALTARLLTDRAGPLYRPGVQSLRHALRSARFALDATAPVTEDLPAAA
jgi:hypothetical protein